MDCFSSLIIKHPFFFKTQEQPGKYDKHLQEKKFDKILDFFQESLYYIKVPNRNHIFAGVV